MLPITRRPSATTRGNAENLFVSSTSCATLRVAGAPEPMATPMSAFFSASTSLTPSPVMATVRFWRCSDSTICCFCSGLTRPKTFPRLISASKASSSRPFNVRASTATSSRSVALRATAATESELSPEITLMSTFCSSKYASVSRASDRSCWRNTTSTGSVSCGAESMLRFSVLDQASPPAPSAPSSLPNTRTRNP